jgi:hypothetical protein
MTRRASIDHSCTDDFLLAYVVLHSERQALGLAEKSVRAAASSSSSGAMRVRERHKRVNREARNRLQ